MGVPINGGIPYMAGSIYDGKSDKHGWFSGTSIRRNLNIDGLYQPTMVKLIMIYFVFVQQVAVDTHPAAGDVLAPDFCDFPWEFLRFLYTFMCVVGIVNCDIHM